MSESYWVLRAIRYPVVAPEALAAGVLGCGEHTDYGCLTLINSDATPGALQVKAADGTWVAAEPVAGAFTTNLGVCFSSCFLTCVGDPGRPANHLVPCERMPFRCGRGGGTGRRRTGWCTRSSGTRASPSRSSTVGFIFTAPHFFWYSRCFIAEPNYTTRVRPLAELGAPVGATGDPGFVYGDHLSQRVAGNYDFGGGAY